MNGSATRYLTVSCRCLALLLVLLSGALIASCSSGNSNGLQDSDGDHQNTGEIVNDVNSNPAESALPNLSPSTDGDSAMTSNSDKPSGQPGGELETITFGSGCFWCTEAVLEQIDGIQDVTSGYMGGQTLNPTYRDICTGRTGHAEVTQVHFDPKVLPLEHLLAWFWKLHDPTTLNRQGADVGTQYRSAIFYHSEAQREAAEKSMQLAQADFKDPIVTEVTKASTYYIAEDDHQDYYRANREAGYCRAVIAPKLDKLNLKK